MNSKHAIAVRKIADDAFETYIKRLTIKQDDWIDIPIPSPLKSHIFEKTGWIVNDYCFVLSIMNVRHIFNRHGDERLENEIGQSHVEPSDFEFLFRNLDKLEVLGLSYPTANGNQTMVCQMNTSSSQFYYHFVMENRSKRKKMALYTLFKKKATRN
jgi:hypothetical protein